MKKKWSLEALGKEVGIYSWGGMNRKRNVADVEALLGYKLPMRKQITVEQEEEIRNACIQVALSRGTVPRLPRTAEPTKEKKLSKKELELRIQAETIAREIIEQSFQAYRDKAKQLRKQLQEHKPVMTVVQYKQLLGCLHPDRQPEESKAKFNTMFHLIQTNRVRLCGANDTDNSELASSLPGSVEEMLARRFK
jgi:hypothetical protein